MTSLSGGPLWGVCIDDTWTYLGFPPPPHIIIPHLFSLNPLGILARHGRRGKRKMRLPGRGGDPVEGLANLLKEGGVGSIRFWMQWNFIERELKPGASHEYEWPTDPFFEVLKKAGFRLIPVVGCGYHRMLPKGADPDRRPNSYLRGVYESTRAIVKRYKGLVDRWQIENEPNWWFAHHAVGWRKGLIWTDPIRGSGFRRRLLRILRKAVKEADPEAAVIINLEVDRMVRDLPFYKRVADIIGVDYYPNYSHASPIDLSTLLPKIRKISEETGRKIMISETGYPSGPSILGFTRKRQAQYIRKMIEVTRDSPLIEEVAIWRLSDSPWRSFPDHENHFGLLEEDWTPKPSWRAFTRGIEE